jgi:hypothetical protein
LLTSGVVVTGCLQVTLLVDADPDVPPRGRHGERVDPGTGLGVGHERARILSLIAEPATPANPFDTGV